MVQNDSTASPWGEFQLKVGDCLYWRIGPLGFWVKRTEAEWQVATTDYDEAGLAAASRDQSPPESAEWTRWATGSETPPVRIRPITPDRSVVVRPEQAFRILPKGQARIYISLPVWVRVELVVDSGSLTLTDIQTVRLSNTWFGSLFEGELCYWIGTTARREADARDPAPHVATAPMTVVNTAGEELPLEKLCLRTANLAIFHGDRRMWTSGVKVLSAGVAEAQKTEVEEGPPKEGVNTRLASEPREESKGGILANTVGFLHSLPGARYVVRGRS